MDKITKLINDEMINDKEIRNIQDEEERVIREYCIKENEFIEKIYKPYKRSLDELTQRLEKRIKQIREVDNENV